MVLYQQRVLRFDVAKPISRKFMNPIILWTADFATVVTRALHWKATSVGIDRADRWESACETVKKHSLVEENILLGGISELGFHPR
jgi:hypothetical protein